MYIQPFGLQPWDLILLTFEVLWERINEPSWFIPAGQYMLAVGLLLLQATLYTEMAPKIVQEEERKKQKQRKELRHNDTLMLELPDNDHGHFAFYTRVSVDMFGELLEMLKP